MRTPLSFEVAMRRIHHAHLKQRNRRERQRKRALRDDNQKKEVSK